MIHGAWRGGLAIVFAVAASGSLRASQDPIPYAEFGKHFLADHGGASSASELPFDEHLSRACSKLTLGMFELYYPCAALVEKKHAEDYARICTGLLEWTKLWVSWLGAGDPNAGTLQADLDLLHAWVEGWKPAALSKAAKGDERDLMVSLGAEAAELEAAKRVTQALLDGQILGVGPREKKALVVVFTPTRLDFVGMLGYAGLLDASQQALLWTDTASTWTSFWLGQAYVLALEYPPWEYDASFEKGLSMDQFEATGLLEHTLQQIGNAVFWACYGDNDAIYLQQAAAMDLVIGVCGKINALEGDAGRGTTGARTEPYERFVPGGNSSGGVLPPIPAAGQDTMKTGRWRAGLGEDHFAAPLRKGQKEGAKYVGKEKPEGLSDVVARDKNAHFLLVSEDNSVKHSIHAPFLGVKAKEKPYPPKEVLLDYREFFRAYKCGFYGWLRENGDESGAEASATKFKELLRKLGTRATDTSLEAVIQEIYGLPLSAANGEADNLEWRYLALLAKGK